MSVTPRLVRSLLAEQHPDLAGLPLRRVGRHGWDNAVFRLGDDLSVRLPIRELAVGLQEHEVRWLPGLAEVLPLPVPAPVRSGVPGCGYPWPWTICRWVPGQLVGLRPVETEPLIRFLSALHRPAPPDAPRNPWRGVPLAQRRVDVGDPELAALWTDLASADPWPGPPVWAHGDFHTANIVQQAGRVSGVIDFGDLTAGDPAVDFIVAWMLPAAARAALREFAGSYDPGLWDRGRAWALAWGIAARRGAAGDSPIARLAERTLSAASGR